MLLGKDVAVAVAASLRSRLKRGIGADIVERIFLLRLSFDVLVFEPSGGGVMPVT